MKRNTKLLGLLFVAALAMSAVVASAAQASGAFEWESGTTSLSASAVTNQKFTTDAGTVECNEVSGQVAVSGTTATSVALTNVVYKNNGNASCPLASFGNATINLHSCFSRFLAGDTEAGTNDSTVGTFNIECTSKGDFIEITAPFGACTIKISPQSGRSSITYQDTTTATPKDIDLIANVSHIIYSYSGYLCQGPGSGTDGTLTGETTLRARNGSTPTGIWVI